MMATALKETLKERVPTLDEAQEILRALAGAYEHVDRLIITLGRLADDPDATLTGEQAYTLVYLARGVRRDGEQLAEWADRIEEAAEMLFLEGIGEGS